MRDDPHLEPEYVRDSEARLHLRSGGAVVIDRTAQCATFTMARAPSTAALLHPHLAAVAAVSSHWRGRDSFHAGAFVTHGGVWGVVGDKVAGKSSMLAALAAEGVPILTDDVLIVDAGTAFAGPRAIDLRADAAASFGPTRPLGRIGDRDRWRLALDPVPPELPFRGWVTLRWAESVRVRPLEGADRLAELLRHRALRLPPPDPPALLDLSSRPILELSRPRRWGSLPDALRALLEAVR